MKRIAFLSSLSPFGKLLLLIGIVFLFAITISFAGLVAGRFFFNTPFGELANFIANPNTPTAVSFLKFYQIINPPTSILINLGVLSRERYVKDELLTRYEKNIDGRIKIPT